TPPLLVDAATWTGVAAMAVPDGVVTDTAPACAENVPVQAVATTTWAATGAVIAPSNRVLRERMAASSDGIAAPRSRVLAFSTSRSSCASGPSAAGPCACVTDLEQGLLGSAFRLRRPRV